MRTATFESIFNRVVTKLGRNPKKSIPPDMANAIVEHLNQRVQQVYEIWLWPEWELTEERAFRQIWNPDNQYLRQSVADGKPDEVFYLPTMLYYTVNAAAISDPPIGLAPDATSPLQPWWTQLSAPIDTFIAYDQGCRRSIGDVIGVYPSNPRFNHSRRCHFHPSEKGIDVKGAGSPTVFITYKMPKPTYTITPFILGKTYSRGQVVFNPTIGDCFQCVTPSTVALPSDPTFWRRVPFLDKWATFVVEGAFADSLTEFDQGGNDDVQAKLILSEKAEARAMDALQAEIDSLTIQGQRLRWHFCHRHFHEWCEGVEWTGGNVTTLTDDCQDELGWVYPTPTFVPQVAWMYLNDIVALKATTATPSLDGKSTRSLLPGSLAQIIIVESGYRTPEQWELVSGPADSSNPGHLAPLDYDSFNNSKHWERRS